MYQKPDESFVSIRTTAGKAAAILDWRRSDITADSDASTEEQKGGIHVPHHAPSTLNVDFTHKPRHAPLTLGFLVRIGYN